VTDFHCLSRRIALPHEQRDPDSGKKSGNLAVDNLQSDVLEVAAHERKTAHREGLRGPDRALI
jgi:hypothetical protein